jgi:calcineurin-like phosphoesterase family protein
LRYFTSDLHFFHKLAHRLYREDLGDLAAMNEAIISEWNRTVKKTDEVYVLGDLSFGKFEETKAIVSRLRGQKILVRGNHDERFSTRQFLEMGFKDVRDLIVLKRPQETWLLRHYPYQSPVRYFYLRLFSKNREAHYHKLYPAYKGQKLLHGHHHSGPVLKFDQLNVAWDIHRRLLREDEVAEIFKQNARSKFSRLKASIEALIW